MLPWVVGCVAMGVRKKFDLKVDKLISVGRLDLLVSGHNRLCTYHIELPLF